jgi:fructose-1,6-bisphosphatase/inositol monophosphatase family enzyme
MHDTYKQFAVNLAYNAGGIMREHFGLGKKKEWKDDHSPVTAADIQINQMVVDAVRAHYPEYCVIAEEGSFAVEGSSYAWVCDPIDGTLPFSSGIPIATFSLALVHDGTPILGVIYDPFSDRLFVAEKGKGAFLNDQPISVSTQDTLEHSYMSIESRSLISFIEKATSMTTKVTRFYCITAAGVLVAAGEFVAALFANGKTWDIAALKVIVEEAGGKVTSLQGEEQRYDQQKLEGGIISNGYVHDILLEKVKQYLAG